MLRRRQFLRLMGSKRKPIIDVGGGLSDSQKEVAVAAENQRRGALAFNF